MKIPNPLMVCASTLVMATLAVHRGWEQRNIARLAAHFGWLRADAARAYAIARDVGFGAAYLAVIGDPYRRPT